MELVAKQAEIIAKVKKVFKSCKNFRHLEVAAKFNSLACRWMTENGFHDGAFELTIEEINVFRNYQGEKP